MQNSDTSIDVFLQQVAGHLHEKNNAAQHRQQGHQHLGPTAVDLAVHLILELYDDGSTRAANITRISSNIEMVAEELLCLSKRIKGLR